MEIDENESSQAVEINKEMNIDNKNETNGNKSNKKENKMYIKIVEEINSFFPKNEQQRDEVLSLYNEMI